ncbi:MAG: hypothetical protein K2W97_05065 [Chthoniobacterales bacterium]|nr:hypothetical protein [Chthoniobacterales bacterium]
MNSSSAMERVGRFIAQEILKRRPPEMREQQPSSTEVENPSSLVPRSSDIASCREIDFSQDDQLPTNMNITTSPSVPSITLEDCRDALKKYPNDSRLILQQDKATGKFSMVGAPSMIIDFGSQKEAEENRAALQAVKNLIIKCAKSYGKPSVNCHPDLLYRIDTGASLDAETLRCILFASTGTIHGNAQGEDYEYQASLADPTRNAIEDLPEGYIPPHELSKAIQSGLAKASIAVQGVRDKISSMRFRAEDENERYKDYALHPNESIPLLDPRTKEPTPGIKSSLQK